jgi:photosystem II stability/assembly factor-like uncharacterized protein
MHRLATMTKTGAWWVVVSLLGSCADGDEPFDVMAQEANATGPEGTTAVVVLPRGSSWQYQDGSVDQGTSWRTYVYGEWPEAPGPLGYGESYLATTIDEGGPPHDPTAYFRRAFAVPAGTKAMFLRVMYDDGFVFYLDGKEGGRASMPAGPITFETLAFGHEIGNRYMTFDISAQIPNLVAGGENTLAVEVHQVARTSSDLVFDAELILWVEDHPDAVYPDGIPPGATWEVWDRGGDLGTAWREPDYDHGDWSAGPSPLGFGEQYVVTDLHPGPITTYFRTDFTATGSLEELVARVRYDDGFVAYLNGTEIARVSMPAGPVTAATLASGHEATTHETFDWSEAIDLVNPDGVNTLAVEVHQSRATSSDLVWDLELVPRTAWIRGAPPTTEALQDVFFTDLDHGFVVGDNGTLMRTTDGGATWTAISTGQSMALMAVHFSDPMHGWVVGRNSVVLRTTDGGVTWISEFLSGELRGVWFVSAQQGWITSYMPIVYRSNDGGSSYTSGDTGAGGAAIFDGLSFADEQHGWIVGKVPAPNGEERPTIYHTGDGGVSWTRQYLAGDDDGYLSDVVAIDAQRAVAVGQGSLWTGAGETKLYTRDGGTTWTMLPETSNRFGLVAVDFVDALHGWAVGISGSILGTVDGGVTWRVQEQAVEAKKPWILGVHFVDANHGWAVGEGGGIWHTTTGGWAVDR